MTLPARYESLYHSAYLKTQIADIGMWSLIPGVSADINSSAGAKRMAANAPLFSFIDRFFPDGPFAFEPNMQDGRFVFLPSVVDHQGMVCAMKTGIGSYAVQIGELQVGAVVVLNALGDVFDWKTGGQIAGLLTEDRTALRSTMDHMRDTVEVVENKFVGNTTLAVVITNASFDKPRLCKIAGMAHDGYARSINPVHTSADGDSIYAVSVGDIEADQDLVGALSAEVVSEAIVRAVENAEGAYGLPCAADLK